MVACDGVSKPRTGGWKTTKNCTDFRQKQTRLCVGSPTATAGDNSQAAPALGGCRGRQRERGRPGPTASSGNSSPGSFSHRTPWEPPKVLPKQPSPVEPSPNENTLLGKSPCSSYKVLCFLLWKRKCILSNVNLLCTSKPTFSAVVSGIDFARTSEIH